MRPAAATIAVLLLLSTPAYAWKCGNPACIMCYGSSAYKYYPNRYPQYAKPTITVDSTPQKVVDGCLAIVQPRKDELLVDLGCGDGRWLISAVRDYGCRAVGVEIDRDVAALATRNVKAAGLSDRVTVIHGDARRYDLAGVDIVVLYLFPELIEQLEPELFRASRVISYSHPIPHVTNQRLVVAKQPVYLWQRTGR